MKKPKSPAQLQEELDARIVKILNKLSMKDQTALLDYAGIIPHDNPKWRTDQLRVTIRK